MTENRWLCVRCLGLLSIVPAELSEKARETCSNCKAEDVWCEGVPKKEKDEK